MGTAEWSGRYKAGPGGVKGQPCDGEYIGVYILYVDVGQYFVG